jgi:hypothetical protein
MIALACCRCRTPVGDAGGEGDHADRRVRLVADYQEDVEWLEAHSRPSSKKLTGINPGSEAPPSTATESIEASRSIVSLLSEA